VTGGRTFLRRLVPGVRASPRDPSVIPAWLGKGKEKDPMPDELRTDETLQVPVLIAGGSLMGRARSLFTLAEGKQPLFEEKGVSSWGRNRNKPGPMTSRPCVC
jgi:hypothetical protein